MKIKELTEQEITTQTINDILIDNNSFYLGAALLVKSYTINTHNQTRINQRLIDASINIMWFNKKYYYEYIEFDDLYKNFIDLYKENTKLYNVIDKEYYRLVSTDCGYYPYWSKQERYERIKELVQFPIEYIQKAYFISLVYDEYYGYNTNITTDIYYLEDDKILCDWNNSNLHDTYYIYNDYSIDTITEYIMNNQSDDYYNFVPENKTVEGIHNEIQYLKERFYEYENGGLIVEINPLSEQILTLMDIWRC